MGPLLRTRSSPSDSASRIYTAYGMSEVPVPIVSGLNPEDERSCGRAADPEHYELRLVDEHDVPVPVGHAGRADRAPRAAVDAQLRLPQHAGEDREAWRNGWFHTGDAFRQDEDGLFYFVDRMKDAIRRRGENISSFEVEAEVISHPLVKDAAAIAVKNPGLDETAEDEEVMVFVVLEHGATLDPVDLIDYLAGRMPRHWVPRFVEYTDALREPIRTSSRRPRSPGGGHHAADLGPRAGGDYVQAGSPDLACLRAE